MSAQATPNEKPRVLVTGSTGKTGGRVLELLRERSIPATGASRVPGSANSVLFDWLDESTWASALEGVGSVYVVAPSNDADPGTTLIRFAEMAQQAGVSRFVLLSASLVEVGGPAMGRLHQWLVDHAADWAVLRPSWFMDNLTDGRHSLALRERSVLETAAGSGAVGFISSRDIASCAVALLEQAEPANRDFILTGPEALTYDDVAEAVSSQTGRTVVHERCDAETIAAHFEASGVPEDFALVLANMDLAIAEGVEARTTPEVENLTGVAPMSLIDFLAENGDLL